MADSVARDIEQEMRRLREGDHFYGAWHGGSKSEGGGPAHGGPAHSLPGSSMAVSRVSEEPPALGLSQTAHGVVAVNGIHQGPLATLWDQVTGGKANPSQYVQVDVHAAAASAGARILGARVPGRLTFRDRASAALWFREHTRLSDADARKLAASLPNASTRIKEADAESIDLSQKVTVALTGPGGKKGSVEMTLGDLLDALFDVEGD